MSYEEFYARIEETAKQFRNQEGPIRVITHLDTDGLTSASILIKALKREEKIFIVSVVKQITEQVLTQIAKESYPVVMFLDLGSGNLQQINNLLKEKTVFILDHHQMQESSFSGYHINPLLFNVSSQEISGAGLAYLFAKALNIKNRESAHLAIIGAIGDMQEKKGFSGINAEILKEASTIEVKMGLRMFGTQTRPLHKVLEYSYDPYIPGVTGSESHAIHFIEEMGIPLKENGKFRKLMHLSSEETKKLITAIIVKRLGSEKTPEDIFGPIYLLKDEEEELPTKDLKEFSTLLNCCGRMNKPSLGIGTCLNDPDFKQKAIELLFSYKREIITSLNWFYAHRKTEAVKEEENFVIIHAEENIKDTLIGTICSILTNSGVYKEGTILLGLAHTLDNNVKISMRVVGKKEINLKEILGEITKRVGCESGGHNYAAGSLIPQEKEQEFLESALVILKKRAMEEVISNKN